jgi:hypothetical protein
MNNKFGMGEKKSCCSPSKIKDSSGGAVLRYPLRLRFLCPSKKSSKTNASVQNLSQHRHHIVALQYSRKSEGSISTMILRDVFPRRHSYADEGQVHRTPNVVEVFSLGSTAFFGQNAHA